MSIKVTNCTVEFSPYRGCFHLVPNPVQPGHHIGQFFSHGCGAGRLTMRTCQHRLICERVGHLSEHRGQLIDSRQQDLITGVTHHQGIRKIIDVFRGATEMDKFGHCAEFFVF